MALLAVHLGLRSVPEMLQRARKGYSWLRGNWLVAVVLALVLAAVPTGFTIFPHLVDVLSRGYRLCIMGAWTLVAIFTAVAALSDRETAERRAIEGQRLLKKQAVGAVLRPLPSLYEATVYIFDQGEDRLFPWYPHLINDLDDPRVFSPGAGATGLAYANQAPVAVVGDAVSNGEHKLTPAQQAFFASYGVVVAVPITEPANDEPLGVLSVISHLNDGTYVTDDRKVQTVAIRKLEDMADEIGEVLSSGGLQ